MKAYALVHSGLFHDLRVTTHPHAEAARQFFTSMGVEGLVVLGTEDLALSGPKLAVLFNKLTDDETKHVAKFATVKDGQRRVFAALEAKYGQQPEEPFNPVETPEGVKAETATGVASPEESLEGSSGPKESNMATKKKTVKKAAKKNGEKKARVSAPLFEELSTSAPTKDMKCGCYIRSLLMRGGKTATTESIIGLVQKYYPDSSAKGSDVSWNRQKLRNAGKKIPAAE